MGRSTSKLLRCVGATLTIAVSLSGGGAHAAVPVPGTTPGSSDPSLESQPIYAGNITQDKTVMIPMRDGVLLAANVARPNVPVDGKAEHRFPVLLVVSPYRKDVIIDSLYPADNYFTDRGYVVLSYDVRGIGDSQGTYPYPFNPLEQRDLYDVIEWAAAEPWSNGNVGMTGQSYLGISQYLAAAQSPPHLKAIFPCKAYSDAYRDIVYHGGIFNAEFLAAWGGLTQAFWTTPPTASNVGATDGSDPLSLSSSWIDHLSGNQNVVTWARSNPTDNEIWQGMAVYTKYPAIAASGIPIYHCGGWYDGFTRGTIENFKNLGSAQNQRLIMGPWAHTDYNQDDSTSPQLGFAYHFDPQFDINHEMLRWYDHYLKGMPDSFVGWPRVEYYSLGENKWKFSDSWPPAGATERDLYLSGNASIGVGSLTAGSPTGAPDMYIAQPNGTGEAASRWINVAALPFLKTDQRADEAHAVSYATAPLDQAVDVAGPIELKLYASTSAIDTDWIAKLVDISTDGSARLVTAGYLRASHRAVDPTLSEPLRPWHPHVSPSTVISGKVYEYNIEIWPTSNVFLPGHQIRLDITSMDLPNHEPLAYPALNQIYHDSVYGSELKLSVVPN
ncbi:MAG: CocE/NonD family hydrolase [Actinomycetota bacterium]